MLALRMHGRVVMLLAVWVGLSGLGGGTIAFALEASPADYRSKHVVLHTDLPAPQARELLARLETILGLISKYWGQPVAGEIDCYVVNDLDAWPAGTLPDLARAKIASNSGVTTTQTLNRGKRFISGKATVYAAAADDNAQHEIVHAYCGQTFGRTGPLWYSEGMAELGQFWQEKNVGVRCKPHMIDYLNHHANKTVAEVVADDAFDGEVAGAARTGDSWQAYTSRWALCYLLVHNSNYSGRFQTLGLAYLNGGKPRFGQMFANQGKELEFEYALFVKQVAQGYRADLCRWDWHHKFRAPDATATSARIEAQRGWQPSGALVAEGQSYSYTADGKWKTAAGEMTTAAGLPSGAGRLEAVVFHDFKLSEPFPLSASGTFVAPAGGKLFLRCREHWADLADNSGFVTVKIKRTSDSPETPRPAGSANVALPGPSDARRAR